MQLSDFKFNMHIVFLIILLFIISCSRQDKPSRDEVSGSIFGTITDYSTGEPVSHANVRLLPSGETVLTGYDGMYEFLDIPDGDYCLTVIKSEYTDLIDDYVISLKNARRVKRDVQIKKKSAHIYITDGKGKNISKLDFGSEQSVVTKSFNVFNNGSVDIDCEILYMCEWISSVSQPQSKIRPGQSAGVIVIINRDLLPTGYSSTVLTINSNNGSAEILIEAYSLNGNPPTVQISPIKDSDVGLKSVLCYGEILSSGDGDIIDCGFCYDSTPLPTLDNNVVHLGPLTGIFSYMLQTFVPGTKYYIRAFAESDLGVGYSSEISVTTLSGLPICDDTSIVNILAEAVSIQSSVSIVKGCTVLEKGFCWSTNPNPTIIDNKVVYTFATDGDFIDRIVTLSPNTKYYVRSYAKSQWGVGYGSVTEFVTLSGLAELKTVSARIVGDNILSGGNITNDPGCVVYSKGVCYGLSPNPTLSTSRCTYDADEPNEFVSVIPKSLAGSGSLYIRAYATTEFGTSYGNQVSIYIP